MKLHDLIKHAAYILILIDYSAKKLFMRPHTLGGTNTFLSDADKRFAIPLHSFSTPVIESLCQYLKHQFIYSL